MAVLQQFKNSASTSLAADLTLAGTSLSVRSGTGNLFPALTGSQFFYTTLISSDRTKTEIVKVTARATDIFTIVRAQDGTAASAFSAGDTIELRVIAADMTQIKTDIDANLTSLALKAPLDSPTFTGTPAAPTPAQFDNTTKLATMAAIQQALGNFSGQVGYSTNQTLTGAQHAGKLINGSGSTPITFTLPLISEMGALGQGGALFFFYTGTSTLTITRAGSNGIVAGSSAQTSLVLGPGDTLGLGAGVGGGNWLGIGGSALIPYTPLGGALNLGATGQIVFPATQNPSAGANTLDDYEEGTWTPVVTAGTGTLTTASGSGTYTKIGRVVHISLSVFITNVGTAGTSINSSLPFNVVNVGHAPGRETSTGAQLLSLLSGASCVIFNNSGGFPGGNGTTLQVSGMYTA